MSILDYLRCLKYLKGIENVSSKSYRSNRRIKKELG